MAPVHDTDLAEQRWTQAEWEHYELWEKIELRLRRRRRLWILGTVAVFVLISSIPIVRDRAPRWQALAGTARLAREINWMKTQANVNHAAYRIRFVEGSSEYVIERLGACAEAGGRVERSGDLFPRASWIGGQSVVPPARGATLDVPLLVSQLCYDPLAGSDASAAGRTLVGIGLAPAKDLTEDRLDRAAILLVSGPSAELSFSFAEN